MFLSQKVVEDESSFWETINPQRNRNIGSSKIDIGSS